MKKTLHHTMSIAMALLLMASTISWKVEKHYCMGHVMDVSFFLPAENCGMESSLDANTTEKIKVENSCCDDEVIFIAAQDDLQASANDFTLDHQLFVLAFTYSYNNLFEFGEAHNLLSEYYPPPIIVKDIQLLDNVFLI